MIYDKHLATCIVCGQSAGWAVVMSGEDTLRVAVCSQHAMNDADSLWRAYVAWCKGRGIVAFKKSAFWTAYMEML